MGGPLPLALLLSPVGSCYTLSTEAGGLAPSQMRVARRSRPGWSWQWNLSLSGFFTRFGKALMLEVGLARAPLFLGLLPPAHGRTLTLGSNLVLGEAASPSGHSCPQLLPGLLPWPSFCALLSSTSLPAVSLLWPFVSPELWANLC